MSPSRRPGRPGLLDTLDRAHVIDGTPEATERALRRQLPAEPELELLVDVGDDVPPVAVGPADSDLMIQLTQLAKLHQGGLLSDGEFVAAKARLLGG